MKVRFTDKGLTVLPNENEIRFFGAPQETNILSSEGEAYYVWKLKRPVEVFCSIDINFPALLLDELYIRESALKRDDWNGNLDEGVYIEGWIADYSKNMGVGLYQEISISKWLFNRPENVERRKAQRKAHAEYAKKSYSEALRKGIERARNKHKPE